MPSTKNPGFVYFIRCETNSLIKIGWTGRHPNARLQRLRATCPVKLVPLGIMVGGIEEERWFHGRFGASHSHGEWFHPSEDLLAEIAPLAGTWPDPRIKFHRRPVEPPPMKLSVQEWGEVTTRTHNGVTRTISEWSKLTGVSVLAYKLRHNRNPNPGKYDWPWEAYRELSKIDAEVAAFDAEVALICL